MSCHHILLQPTKTKLNSIESGSGASSGVGSEPQLAISTVISDRAMIGVFMFLNWVSDHEDTIRFSGLLSKLNLMSDHYPSCQHFSTVNNHNDHVYAIRAR